MNIAQLVVIDVSVYLENLQKLVVEENALKLILMTIVEVVVTVAYNVVLC